MLWDFQNLRWSSMKMLLNNETNLISRMSVSRATSPINTISPNNLQQTSVAVVRNCYTRRPVSGSGFSNLPQSLPAPLPTPYYQTRARVGNDLFWGRGWFSGFFWGEQHQHLHFLLYSSFVFDRQLTKRIKGSLQKNSMEFSMLSKTQSPHSPSMGKI